MVLMHELAHVRARATGCSTLAARALCALFWFHPGVWWIARALRDDCELACDDRVIAAGVRRSDYAELLVNVADAPSRERAPRARRSRSRGGADCARVSPPCSTRGTTSARSRADGRRSPR